MPGTSDSSDSFYHAAACCPILAQCGVRPEYGLNPRPYGVALGHPISVRPQADGTIGSDNPICLQGVRYDGVIRVSGSDFHEGQFLARALWCGRDTGDLTSLRLPRTAPTWRQLKLLRLSKSWFDHAAAGSSCVEGSCDRLPPRGRRCRRWSVPHGTALGARRHRARILSKTTPIHFRNGVAGMRLAIAWRRRSCSSSKSSL